MSNPLIPIMLGLLVLTILPALVWLIGIGAWLSRSQRMSGQYPQNPSSVPRVSVIVAARNEENSIQNSIKSLILCEWPEESVEFIIVDDHSTDHTAALIRGCAQLDSRVQYLCAPDTPVNMGPKKRALTAALQIASGEIVLFTDADCVVPSKWIHSMVREFRDSNVGAVHSASLPSRFTGNKLYFYERQMVNLTMASAAGWGSPASACGHSIAYRRSALDQIGGFAFPNLPSGDDDLTLQAVYRAGWKTRFASDSYSVVIDTRTGDLSQALSASARHQSTVRYYPGYWRLLYAASIVATLLCIVLPLAAILERAFVPLALLSVLSKISLDATAALLVSRQLKTPMTVVSAMAAASALPAIAIQRMVALLRPTYLWKSARYSSRPNASGVESPVVNPTRL